VKKSPASKPEFHDGFGWGGDAVPDDSPERCTDYYRRPEGKMQCVCKTGHTGRHRYGRRPSPPPATSNEEGK
jgi:hypothetical protein